MHMSYSDSPSSHPAGQLSEEFLNTLTNISIFLDVELIAVAAGTILFGIQSGGVNMFFVIILSGTIGTAMGVCVTIFAGHTLVEYAIQHGVRNWHRVLFVHIIITLAFFVSLLIAPASFSSACLLWGALSPFGLLLSPVVAIDPGLARANTLIGIILTIVGIFVKIVVIPMPEPDFASFISVIGGIMTILGVGHHV